MEPARAYQELSLPEVAMGVDNGTAKGEPDPGDAGPSDPDEGVRWLRSLTPRQRMNLYRHGES